jgi:hypothetical protein
MLKTTHNAGFFSCCSVRLNEITNYFNHNRKLPEIVDSSEQFNWYKDTNNDITFQYFDHYDDNDINITYKSDINYNHLYQFQNYKLLDLTNICPFVEKYFSPSKYIVKLINNIETKYNIKDYNNICVLFHRGNDKITETSLCTYDSILNKANEILKTNPNIQFLIQSDETEFIERMLEEFPSNSFSFNDEIRHINKTNSTVDKIFRNSNNMYSKYYLAITIIMSRCKYIVCGSGNCSIWIAFYRGNANNMYQFLNDKWV